MKTLLSLTLGALLFAGVSATSYAQEVTPNGAVDPGHPRVNQVDSRERRQDSRIANGDRSGQLTNGETASIDRRENNIQNSKALDQAGHNGHLTKRRTAPPQPPPEPSEPHDPPRQAQPPRPGLTAAAHLFIPGRSCRPPPRSFRRGGGLCLESGNALTFAGRRSRR